VLPPINPPTSEAMTPNNMKVMASPNVNRSEMLKDLRRGKSRAPPT